MQSANVNNEQRLLVPRTPANFHTLKEQVTVNEVTSNRTLAVWTIYTAQPRSAIPPRGIKGRRRRYHRLADCSGPAGRPRCGPTSDVDRTGNELIRCIEDFRMYVLPLVFSPSLLGRSVFLDAAVEVLVQLHRHSAPQYSALEQKSPLLKSYEKALVLAKSSIAAPEARHQKETLLAIDILGVAVTLIQLHDPDWDGAFNRWACETAILLEGVGSHETSTVHETFCPLEKLAFIMPAYAGQPSPFEGTSWQQLERPSSTKSPEYMLRLRIIATELFIKLPRIICAIRLLRNDPHDSAILQSALKLLEAVITLKDEEAENGMLHRIQLVQTQDSSLRLIAPFSFTFCSLEEMDVAVDYWKARAVVLRLYIAAISLTTPEHPDQTRGAELLIQGLRCCTNVLMCTQYALDNAPCGTRCMTAGVLVIWTILRLQQTYRGVPTDVVGQYLQKLMQKCWTGWMFPDSMPVFNIMAGVLEGGPLCPVFTRIVRGVQPEA